MGAGVEYHRRELALALDATQPGHSLPSLPPGATSILDIGCGMGQTLMALRLDPDIEAWGVDPDAEAIMAGREIVGSNIHLVLGAGEHLPFPDASFDLVFSRVALPYMDIPTTLAEVSRVLRPNGTFWAALHPPSMLARRMGEDLVRGRARDLAFCCLVALNSGWLRIFGRQFRIRGHSETVQTRAGFQKLLRASGLRPLPAATRSSQLIIEARKRAGILDPPQPQSDPGCNPATRNTGGLRRL